jgi:hypothetical protein
MLVGKRAGDPRKCPMECCDGLFHNGMDGMGRQGNITTTIVALGARLTVMHNYNRKNSTQFYRPAV